MTYYCMIRDIEFRLVMVALVWTQCQYTLLLHNAVDVSDSELCQSRADRVREASPRNGIVHLRKWDRSVVRIRWVPLCNSLSYHPTTLVTTWLNNHLLFFLKITHTCLGWFSWPSPSSRLPYRWISWRILPWELEGITSPCCLLIGQYPQHKTLCPPVAIVKRCYGICL